MAEDASQQPQRPRSSAPVVWTPEDAANFLSATIKESQRPLAEALKRQGVPHWVFGLVVLVAVAGSVIGWLYLDQRMTKSEKHYVAFQSQLKGQAAEYREAWHEARDGKENLQAQYLQAVQELARVRGQNEAMETRMVGLQSQARKTAEDAEQLRKRLEEQKDSFADRLQVLQADYEKLLLQAEKHGGEDQTVAEKLRTLEEAKAAAEARAEDLSEELAAANKRNRSLALQVDGLEQEKMALRKQLEAIKSLLEESQGVSDSQAAGGE